MKLGSSKQVKNKKSYTWILQPYFPSLLWSYGACLISYYCHVNLSCRNNVFGTSGEGFSFSKYIVVVLQEKSIELLPDVIQQQLKNGKLHENGLLPSNAGGFPANSNDAREQGPILTGLLVPPVISSSVQGTNNVMTSPIHSTLNSSSKLGGSVSFRTNNYGNFGASMLPKGFFNEAEKGWTPDSGLRKNFSFDDVSPAIPNTNIATSPIRELKSSSSQKPGSIPKQNGSLNKVHSRSSYLKGSIANPVTSLRSNLGMLMDSAQDSSVLGKLAFSDKTDVPQMLHSNDSMDISWR